MIIHCFQAIAITGADQFRVKVPFPSLRGNGPLALNWAPPSMYGKDYENTGINMKAQDWDQNYKHETGIKNIYMGLGSKMHTRDWD